MSLSNTMPKTGLYLPVVTPLAQAIGRDINMVFYLLTIALTALVLAVKVWGLVVLTMTALAFVPVMFLFIIILTFP